MHDQNNYPLGTSDPTDWTLDADWNTQERNLFKDLTINLNTTASGKISYLSVYPNPISDDRAVFIFNSPMAVTCSFVVVDAKYQVVLPLQTSTTASRGQSFLLDVSGGFQQGKLYRLYYVLRDGSTLYYKGHGDIKIGQ